jgi:hypothetical protein
MPNAAAFMARRRADHPASTGLEMPAIRFRATARSPCTAYLAAASSRANMGRRRGDQRAGNRPVSEPCGMTPRTANDQAPGSGRWLAQAAGPGRPMTGDTLPVPRLWAAATTSGTDHGGGGAEFRQHRPLGPERLVRSSSASSGRVWLGDNCGLRIRIQASDLPGRICVLAATSPASAHPRCRQATGRWNELLGLHRCASLAVNAETVTPDGYGPTGWA